jgi:cell wall-associated NlpC family hydrolase
MSFVTTFILAHALTFGNPECPIQLSQEVVVTSATRDSVVDYAKTFLGTPYKYANASPNSGFDCSGFTWFVFNHFGVDIPRSSRDYMSLGTRVTLETCNKGDIMLFTGTDHRNRTVGHVGIVISNRGDSLQFIHASSSDKHYGVVITNYYKSNYPKRFLGVTSVLPE